MHLLEHKSERKKKEGFIRFEVGKTKQWQWQPDFSLVPDSDLQRASFIIIIFLLYEIGSGPKWI